jgi:hypothetical protein
LARTRTGINYEFKGLERATRLELATLSLGS